MSAQQKVDYLQLETGYQFPPARYKLDSSTVSTYNKAVGESGSFHRDTDLVPPMAVAAYAMAALAEGILLPPGTIHVSQELEFLDAVSVKDTITSCARVTKKQSRGRFHLLTIDISVFNQKEKAVLAGETSFLSPEQGQDNTV